MIHVPTEAHTARPGATRLTRHTDKSLRTRPTARLSRLPHAVRYASGVVSSERTAQSIFEVPETFDATNDGPVPDDSPNRELSTSLSYSVDTSWLRSAARCRARHGERTREVAPHTEASDGALYRRAHKAPPATSERTSRLRALRQRRSRSGAARGPHPALRRRAAV